jgi:hypothetical protein
MNFLIVSAALHDVSKLFEYEHREGREVLSRVGELYPHGFHEASMALEAGLPEEIAHIILTHPPTTRDCPRMAEGLILHFCTTVT